MFPRNSNILTKKIGEVKGEEPPREIKLLPS